MSVMVHLKDEFEKIDTLGFLEVDNNADTWALHCKCVTAIKKIIQELKKFNKNILPFH